MIETPRNIGSETQEIKEKHAGGRPLAFSTPEELQVKIEEYYDHCDNRMVEVYLKEAGEVLMINKPAPYTMGGLAVALGVDRKTLVNYSHKEEFFPTINAARAKVEASLEERMVEKDTFSPGQIFIAKNGFGWKDKNETDLNHSGEVGVKMEILNFSTPIENEQED